METDEELETGYGPGTPPGDNLCNDYAQRLGDAFGALARARGDVVHDDGTLMSSDRGSASPFGNVAVIRTPLDDEGWRRVTQQLADFYRPGPAGGYLVFSAWPTPDLTGAGFGRVGHPPLMWRPPAPIDFSVASPPGLEIREVVDADTARDWEQVMVEGYPEPELQPFRPGCLLPVEALTAPGWRHWVGALDGEPVATSSAYVSSTHVDVEFIATMPGARGRGVGRAMTAVATHADPGLPALLISSDLGRPVYEGLGYLPLLRFSLWIGHR